MYRDSLFFLYHIEEACRHIMSILPETEDEFKADKTVCYAVVKNLEMMGEATKHIEADIKYKWRSIEWKKMAGMRNKLTHEYWGINYDVVWGTAKYIVPELVEQIRSVIEQEKIKRT